MPLGTLDRTPPPFFRQGASALTKLAVFSALALFLMVLDARLGMTSPLRAALATALYPLQWLARQPVNWLSDGGQYFESLRAAQARADAAHRQLTGQLQRAGQVEQLLLENTQLRQTLELRERLAAPAQAAQVLYQAADPYARKIVIDKGSRQGVSAGSPVIDSAGVLGQVTRVYPLTSEVTLVTDREQVIPVLNTRTGARALAYGESGLHAQGLELRFMAANADVQPGDVLSTSGIDAVYPPGLPVARVSKVERRGDTPFARISCEPLARVDAALHVLVLHPLLDQVPPPPPVEEKVEPARKGRARK